MKKSARKYFIVLVYGFLLICTLFFVACTILSGNSDSETSGSDKSIESWSTFSLSEEGDYYIMVSTTAYMYREDFVIPSEYNGLPVREIADKCFYQFGLISVTIPDTVISIGNHAFGENADLCMVSLPNSIEEIGEYAFSGCDKLYHIEIPSMEKIGINAFAGSGLRSVEVPEGVEIIEAGAFDCEQLVSISLPSTLVSIADLPTFKLKEVYNFSSIEIPLANDTSCYNVYDGYAEESMLSVTEEGLIFYKEEEEYVLLAYEGYASEIILPQDYNSMAYRIAEYAFMLCKQVKSIVIPETVTAVGAAIFYMDSNDAAPTAKPTVNYIFCEDTSLPETWDDDWNVVEYKTPYDLICEDGDRVFWGDDWIYVDDMPTVK